MKTSASLLAAAILGVSSAQAGETTTYTVSPYFAPVTYAPVVIDQDLLNAYIAYQQQAYEHYLKVQQHLAANTPDYLKIPAIPKVPAFNQNFNTMASPFQDEMAPQHNQLQTEMQAPSTMYPYTVNIEQTIAERQKQIDAKLENAQKRLTERQNTLDANDKAL